MIAKRLAEIMTAIAGVLETNSLPNPVVVPDDVEAREAREKLLTLAEHYELNFRNCWDCQDLCAKVLRAALREAARIDRRYTP